MNTQQYEKFKLLKNAGLALDYLTGMVDKKQDYLPYWLVAPHESPAFARHCRVDDSELVASWYEAIVSLRHLMGTEEGLKAERGFQRHLLRSWGKHGLRYNEDYPWSHTNHSSFHEMAYILGALNRWKAEEPDNKEVEKKARELVRGLRSLVIERKTRVFWSGDYPEKEPVYEFPNDVYLKDRGWDLSCHTGRGEPSVRNGMMLHSLVKRWEIANDEVALDLARGMANFLTGVSRYFNYKGEFFGHVHSAVWVASGLVRLGRLTNNDNYLSKGHQIYKYVKSISSSFGWVPEYAQWHPMSEEHSETCCIKDMIECSLELIDAGFDEYWDVVNNYVRNQLIEHQIRDGDFISTDNSRKDTEEITYRDINKRVVGGFSGGGEPNSISLLRFRSIAGCCAGTAPQALYLAWKRSSVENNGIITVNLPFDKENEKVKVETGYPNEGWMRVTSGKDCELRIRIFSWMGDKLETKIAGRPVAPIWKEGCLRFPEIHKGEMVEIRHKLRTEERREGIRNTEYEVSWRGSDIVEINPPGLPLRLYQRRLGIPKEYPQPINISTSGKGFEAGSTQQK